MTLSNLQMLYEVHAAAQKYSMARERKVACAIYRSEDPENSLVGFNSFPENCDTEVDERHQRPALYKWMEHAERNAIYFAARNGIPIQGCTMFLPWYPCVDCARAIIQSGIRELVCYKPDFNDPKWGEDFKIAARMFSESGVIETYEDPWVPLSPEAQAQLDAGLESAKTQEIVVRDEDFSQYADEDDGECQ